jgi:Sulfatase-modifying factor enzyme 1/Galactose oxidase, central domain
VPLGANPVTGYHEFYHLRSAWDGHSDPRQLPIPTHRDDGSIEVTGSTGIVVVLLPGGAFQLGATRDPAGPDCDPQCRQLETPPREVTLDPFLLARHEITRGQWERLTGTRPFWWQPGHTYDGRAYHGASLLPNGDVLLTGGLAAQPANIATNDESIPIPSCDVWSPTTGTWSQTASLPVAAAFHGQAAHGAGAIVSGGFTVPLSTLATTAQTLLHDGALLVYGGGVWPNTIGDGWVFTVP